MYRVIVALVAVMCCVLAGHATLADQADAGDISGYVAAQNLAGMTWSVEGETVELWTLDPDQSVVLPVATTTIAEDNSFSFSGVPAGTYYWVQISGVDHVSGGRPCNDPSVFSVQPGSVANALIVCTR